MCWKVFFFNKPSQVLEVRVLKSRYTLLDSTENVSGGPGEQVQITETYLSTVLAALVGISVIYTSTVVYKLQYQTAAI